MAFKLCTIVICGEEWGFDYDALVCWLAVTVIILRWELAPLRVRSEVPTVHQRRCWCLALVVVEMLATRLLVSHRHPASPPLAEQHRHQHQH